MAQPVVSAEIAFATNPASTPTWTDVTDYLQAFSYQRGRQTERDVMQAGTATLVMDNLDRRFDPTYTSSPYSPNVVPMRRVRISAVWNAVTYRLFSGYVDGWTPLYPGPLDSNVPLACTDAFKVFALKNLNTTFGAEGSGTRIVNVLVNAIGWPVGDLDINAGNSVIQAVVALIETPALQHIQDVTSSENGLFFINGAGVAVFRQRQARYFSPYSVSQATFGDGAGSELLYVDLALDYGDTQLWNEIRVQRLDGTTQVASDSASQAKYYPRTLSKTGLLLTTDNEALDAANWMLGQYKNPGLRIASITLNGEGDPTNLWPQLLGRELGDRITVRRRPPGGGSMIEQQSFIEAMQVNWTAEGGFFNHEWTLSPADLANYWILGDSTYGSLGNTTRLGY